MERPCLTLVQPSVQFTSHGPRMKLNSSKNYVQPPIDDLMSFSDVFKWAIVGYWRIRKLLNDERYHREEIVGDNGTRYDVHLHLLREQELTDTMKKLCDISKAWMKVDNELFLQWEQMEVVYDSLYDDGFFKPGGMERKDYWRWAWHLTAFNGVLRILKMIYSFKDELCS